MGWPGKFMDLLCSSWVALILGSLLKASYYNFFSGTLKYLVHFFTPRFARILS
jgi:hypothetical protein